MKQEQERVRGLMLDTIVLLCRNGLSFKTSLKIEGLIAVTTDDNDIFVVHINDVKSNVQINDQGLPVSTINKARRQLALPANKPEVPECSFSSTGYRTMEDLQAAVSNADMLPMESNDDRNNSNPENIDNATSVVKQEYPDYEYADLSPSAGEDDVIFVKSEESVSGSFRKHYKANKQDSTMNSGSNQHHRDSSDTTVPVPTEYGESEQSASHIQASYENSTNYQAVDDCLENSQSTEKQLADFGSGRKRRAGLSYTDTSFNSDSDFEGEDENGHFSDETEDPDYCPDYNDYSSADDLPNQGWDTAANEEKGSTSWVVFLFTRQLQLGRRSCL